MRHNSADVGIRDGPAELSPKIKRPAVRGANDNPVAHFYVLAVEHAAGVTVFLECVWPLFRTNPTFP